MNKLLSNKVLALSMLALAVGESWGMDQTPLLNNSQTNMPQNIVVNLHPNVLLGGNTNLKTLTMLKKSPSYKWFDAKGVTSLEGMKIICREVEKYIPSGIARFSLTYTCSKTEICTRLDLNWSELSSFFNLVEIRSTNQPNYESPKKRKQKVLQEWSPRSSEPFKWASQNNVDTHKDLLSVTFEAIILSGQKIDVNRYIKGNNLLLLKFLDDNWEVLQPFMNQALRQIQQPVLQNQQIQQPVLQNQPLPIPPIQLQNQQQPQQTQNTSTQSAAVHNSNDDFFFNPPDDDYGNGEFSFNPPDDDYGNGEFYFNPLDDDPSAWKFEGF